MVPDDWRVETKILPIFGGIGDGRPDGNPPEGGPTLRLEGVAVFGGWGDQLRGARRRARHRLTDARPARRSARTER